MALFSPPETLNEPALNARSARMNTLAYTSSTQFRDPRLQSRKPASNWLVVVVPSPSLIQEPSINAHTLATSPPGRFADGIIIPLFPSLYAQLTAIAREYSMPSTVGLCIYLQTVHAGAMTTPRISDETWPLLWNHLTDADGSRSLPGPPIAGRIEFDIDHRKGRWLETWLGLSRKASVDLNPAFRSPWHMREESKLTDKAPFEYATPEPEPEHESPPEDYISASRKASPPRNRGHLRRLSLLRGSDSSLVSTSPAKPSMNNLPTIISPSPQAPGPMSPQNQELAERVQSWREGSLVNLPDVLDRLKTGENQQVSSSSVHTTAVERNISPQEDEAPAELNLEDFAWSVSSLGPGTDIASPLEIPSPLVSVHLVGRLAGSVCLTPTTATSFGPNDDAFDYDASTISRLPSPDIAYRAIDDVPCTPSTATSWGAPSWKASEGGEDMEMDSVDLAYRCAGSVPASPVEDGSDIFLDAWKLTPWGLMWPFGLVQEEEQTRPSLWLYNPLRGAIRAQEKISHWPYNTARGGLTGIRQEQAPSELAAEQTTSQPAYNAYVGYFADSPYHRADWKPIEGDSDAWKLNPWGHIWPYQKQISVEESLWPLNPSRGTVAMSGTTHWAYNPTRGQLKRSATASTISAALTSTPVPVRSHAYHGYLQHSTFMTTSSTLFLDEEFSKQDAWKLNPWGHIWPYAKPRSKGSATKDKEHPIVEDSSAALSLSSVQVQPEQKVRLASFVLPTRHDAWKVTPWGFVWPYNRQGPQTPVTLDVQPDSEYPNFDLYPSPFRGVSTKTQDDSYEEAEADEPNLDPQLRLTYPKFNLCDLFSHLDNKTSSDGLVTDPVVYPILEIYPAASDASVEEEFDLDTDLPVIYPNFNLYPSVYPFLEIYPIALKAPATICEHSHPVRASLADVPSILPNLSPESPSFTALALAAFDVIYPELTIYPDVTGRDSAKIDRYPILSIYPAVYPNFDLYPAPAGQGYDRKPDAEKIGSRSSFSPQVYTQSIIDRTIHPPSPRMGKLSKNDGQQFDQELGYPTFVLYPPVYPHLEPYPPQFHYLPSLSQARGSFEYDLKGHCHAYPNIEPYPANHVEASHKCTHPYLHGQNQPNPSPSERRLSSELQLHTRKQIAYDLRGHQNIYPEIEPYRRGFPERQQRRSHDALHRLVFKAGYVMTPSARSGVAFRVRGDSHSYQAQWNLGCYPSEYPIVEPYPAPTSGNTAEERIKRLALVLGADKALRRLSNHASPMTCSFASSLYSPLHPPPLSPRC